MYYTFLGEVTTKNLSWNTLMTGEGVFFTWEVSTVPRNFSPLAKNIYDYALDNGCVVMVQWILRLCGKPGYRLAGKCRKEFPKKGNTGGWGTVTLRGR